MTRTLLVMALLAWLPAAAAAQQVVPGRNEILRLDGTTARPSDAYERDRDLGRYRIGADNEGYAAGGTLRWDWNTTRMKLSPGYGIQFSQTFSDLVTPLSIQSTDAGKGPWNLIVADTLFNGTEDSVMYFGYNVTAGGGNAVDAEPSMRFAIEQDFNDGVRHNVEAYFEWRDGSAISPRKQLRPLFWQFDRANGDLVATEMLSQGISFKTWEVTPQVWANFGPAGLSLNGTATQSANTTLVVGAQNGKFGTFQMTGGFEILPEGANHWKIISNGITALELFNNGKVSISASQQITFGLLSVGVPDALKDVTYSLYIQRVASQSTSLLRIATESFPAGGSTLLEVAANGSTSINQPALGTNVLKLATIATNDDPAENFFQHRATTTNNTPTALAAVTIATSTNTVIGCYITARRTGGAAGAAEDGAGYYVEVVVKNTAGTVAELAAETLRVIGESQAGWTVAAAASGDQEIFSVTGATDNNVTWHSSCRTWPVSS